MAQLKTHEFSAFIRREGTPYRIVLVYGPDRGLVSERAALIAAKTGVDLTDDFAVLKLEASDLTGDPGRLADEFSAISLFGGDRLVWVKNAGNDRGLIQSLTAVAETDPGSSHLLIEAGDLKKSSGLRKLVETARTALAVPCYADDARGIQTLIDDELGGANLVVDADARQRLAQLLGGDRLASRNELKKLALYCHGSGTVTDNDVIEAIGDVAALSVDDAVDAVFSGDLVRLEASLERILASKTSVFLVLRGCILQFEQLDVMRALVESHGRQPAQAISEKGRGIHFKRKPVVERALRHWRLEAINREMRRLSEAVFETRRRPHLEASIARQALLRTCLLSR
ncbi:DNA polymerase III subunit delta [Hoeflea sp. YIM 152468]|uniref:DNA polymerase III subunit delta n=1 Tax=Hoeflea sp. YIM 152468 TaxID=3031759 RepID=UPI0023DBE2BD|nr:DNA polymerase III subunit delta [Hoeflea sp. YIM 152468]MDF1610509.1 DNA polymerase III subunit delta [Hoeflea sp. YIM 152468]